jgi:hypothetical protein
VTLAWLLGALSATSTGGTTMPTRSNDQERTAGIPDGDVPGTLLVQLEPPSTEATTLSQLPAVITDQQGTGPQLFALVEACDPNRVYCYGIDVGAGAFTVRRNPDSHQTDFGSWISMQTAFKRLDGLAGGPGHLALVVFDSAPAVAVTAMAHGWQALVMAPANELEYRKQWNWREAMLGCVDRCVTLYREKVTKYGRDPQATEDQHVKAVKQRSGPQ